MLEILHIYGVNGSSVIEKSKTINDLFDIIFCNGFAQLRICTAFGIEPLNINEMWSGSSTLRHLIFDGQTELVYHKLNVLCPNLYRSNSLGQSSIDFVTNDIQMRMNSAAFSDSKRVLSEITKIKQFQSEKTFLLDYCSIYDNEMFRYVLGGRIFPKSDPYCLASFRIEIKLHREFPFKSPDGRFLDPIYHPMVERNGRHCCCWGLDPDSWHPTTSIVRLITGMIHTIDHPDQWEGHGDSYRSHEYINNYNVFYEKALRSVFKYGQSRFFISSNKMKD